MHSMKNQSGRKSTTKHLVYGANKRSRANVFQASHATVQRILVKSRTISIVVLLSSIFLAAEANAYLIKDFGFTNLANANAGLNAKVHSILNYDSNYAPGKYDYVYQVTNTGIGPIRHFGVFAGVLPPINTTLCTIAPNAAGCAAPGALPNWISNLARPDPTWDIVIASDGLVNPANYDVVWGKLNGLASGQTLTFQAASPNPPIFGGAFIDPIATSSGFYVEDTAGNIAQATYVPEPASILLLLGGFLGMQLARNKRGFS